MKKGPGKLSFNLINNKHVRAVFQKPRTSWKSILFFLALHQKQMSFWKTRVTYYSETFRSKGAKSGLAILQEEKRRLALSKA